VQTAAKDGKNGCGKSTAVISKLLKIKYNDGMQFPGSFAINAT